MNPFAYYDSLLIGSKLTEYADFFAESEVHVFAYLSCLLSIYDKRPANEWGYPFVGTEYGAPFSVEVQSAVEMLRLRGQFVQNAKGTIISSEGLEELESLSELSQFSRRQNALESACASTLAMSLGTLRNALQEEPELNRAITLGGTKPLLENGGALDLLYECFDSLHSAINRPTPDLFIPATIWITSLAQPSQTEKPKTT